LLHEAVHELSNFIEAAVADVACHSDQGTSLQLKDKALAAMGLTTEQVGTLSLCLRSHSHQTQPTK
jgi:hypothetical protein